MPDLNPEHPEVVLASSSKMQGAKQSPSADPSDSAIAATPGKARKISRRQFGRDAAIATAASLSVPALIATEASAGIALPAGAPGGPATEQEKPGAREKPPAPSAAQATAPGPLKGLTAKQVADVDAKLANILRKHPSRFSAEQKRHLRRLLAQQERLLAPVRVFKVENGDPPASVLRVEFSDVILPPAKKGSD
jgi:hypothetical protein